MWSNVHVECVFGLALVGIFAAMLNSSRPRDLTRREAAKAIGIVAVGLLATACNPYGFGLLRYMFENSFVPQVLDIAELRPPYLPNYRAFFAWTIAGGVLIVLSWLGRRLVRRPVHRSFSEGGSLGGGGRVDLYAMPSYDSLFNAFVTLLVTIDPPGLAPLFLGVTRGMNRDERAQVSMRASIIGFAVLALFAVAGAQILSVFGITLPAFRVAGGLLLFFIAFEMIFERRQDRKEKISDVAITKDLIHNIAAFPLAIPLIAGPGAISATVLLSGSFQGAGAQAALVGIIFVCLVLTYLVFVLSERIDRFLGNTGRSILTRLLGVILAALAVQFVADGIKALMSA